MKRWFLSALRLHDIHQRVLNDDWFIDKNFCIGFLLFDRLFGRLTLHQTPSNQRGYAVALKKFNHLEEHGVPGRLAEYQREQQD